jgi:hypothetical protein
MGALFNVYCGGGAVLGEAEQVGRLIPPSAFPEMWCFTTPTTSPRISKHTSLPSIEGEPQPFTYTSDAPSRNPRQDAANAAQGAAHLQERDR